MKGVSLKTVNTQGFKVLFVVLVLLVTFMPNVYVFAESPISRIVPDCGIDCNWTHLVTLARNILNFFIYMAVPIAAIMFAYAGWLFVTGRGNSGQISKAKELFLNVAIGLLIVLVAWAVVDFVLKSLADTGTYVPVLDSVRTEN